jgi:micrococcal nuclease
LSAGRSVLGAAVLALAAAAGAAAQARETPDSGPSRPNDTLPTCVVTQVVDGDTLQCRGAGRIRLLGIDTPELSQRPFGRQAADALRDLAPPGTKLAVERDVQPRDRYGRTLAYLWSNDGMVNWALVRGGWAVTLTYPPNVRYVKWLTRAQRLAQADRAGLWARDGFSCLPRDRRRGRCD